MRSIKRRFENISKKNPNWSSYVCFAETIKNQNFSKQMIHCWFYKLVENDDYSKPDKKAIFGHLEFLTNTLRTIKIEDKKPP